MSQAQPSRGRELRIGRARLEIKIDPSVTLSRLFAFESTLAPGGGMPYLHRHREMEEVFYVLEGMIEYTRGDDTILATKPKRSSLRPRVFWVGHVLCC